MSDLLVCPKCHFSAAVPVGPCPRCAKGEMELLALTGRAIEIKPPSARRSPPPPVTPAAVPTHSPSGSKESEKHLCHGCNHLFEEPLTRCPWCGGVVQSVRSARGRGWVLAFCGSFLLVFMGGITWLVTEIIRNSDKPGAKTRFNGGTGEMVLIYGIFAAVLAFGLGALIAGITQIVTGRRNLAAIRVMLWLAGALAVFAVIAEFVL